MPVVTYFFIFQKKTPAWGFSPYQMQLLSFIWTALPWITRFDWSSFKWILALVHFVSPLFQVSREIWMEFNISKYQYFDIWRCNRFNKTNNPVLKMYFHSFIQSNNFHGHPSQSMTQFKLLQDFYNIKTSCETQLNILVGRKLKK